MQQLEQRGNCLLFDFSRIKGMNFKEFAYNVLNSIEAKERSYDMGADREQLVFSWQEQDFVFICEELCESVWIEPLRQNCEQDLLIKRLCCAIKTSIYPILH